MEQRSGNLNGSRGVFGLVAAVREATIEDVGRLLADGKLAITYIDRAVFELTPNQRIRHSLRAAKIHVVVPTRINATTVTYHDPLPPRIVRKSTRLFRLAYGGLGSHRVVCSRPGAAKH
jgi:hypothetical protein